jgi:hypothetical protein
MDWSVALGISMPKCKLVNPFVAPKPCKNPVPPSKLTCEKEKSGAKIRKLVIMSDFIVFILR